MEIKKILGILITTFCSLFCFSQVTVSGPTCVISNVPYRYTISGLGDSVSTMKLCVNGGAIVNGVANCNPATATKVVVISWFGNGNISVFSSRGNASVNIGLTRPLESGVIAAAQQVQKIDSLTIPVTLLCTASAGGSCTASYQYQWQQSSDNQDWSDIQGGNNINLSFSSAPSGTRYFRRKTTDPGSNTIAYSNTALIIVQATSHNN